VFFAAVIGVVATILAASIKGKNWPGLPLVWFASACTILVLGIIFGAV
jgi:cytochrome c oxidase assembly factor CtaG